MPIAPFRPVEATLLSAALWILGWGMLPWRRVRRVALLVLIVAAGVGVAGWRVAAAYRQPTAIVLADDVPLRQAPYGSAEPVRRLNAGAAVRVERQAGLWLLVERPGGAGWVQVGEVARL